MSSGEVKMVKDTGGGRRGGGHRCREGIVRSGRAGAREREAEGSGRAPGARVQGSRRGGTPSQATEILYKDMLVAQHKLALDNIHSSSCCAIRCIPD